jgi:hypothetical protein
MGSVVMLSEAGIAGNWAAYFDVSGFGLVFVQMTTIYQTKHLSIGATPFYPANGIAVFRGLESGVQWMLPRIGAAIWPLGLLALARLFFHRFDPARVRAMPNEKARRSWIGRLNFMTKPLARLFVAAGHALLSSSSRASLLRSAATDALTTIAAFPLASLAIIGFAIAALATDAKSLLTGVMPIAFAACAIAIADVASREKRAGTTALVYASPSLRAQFVAWKFASALILTFAFLAVPLIRALAVRPASALPLLVGVAFTCAAATTLGILSSNPKTFIVTFLMFWYITTQDKGASPQLDFAGWYGTATPLVIAAYAALTLAFLALAHAFHRSELRRRW